MLSPSAFYNTIINSNTDETIIDTRSSNDFSNGHLQLSTSIPLVFFSSNSAPQTISKFESAVKEFNRKRPINKRSHQPIFVILPDSDDINPDLIVNAVKKSCNTSDVFALRPPFTQFSRYYPQVCTTSKLPSQSSSLYCFTPNEIIPGLFLGGFPMNDPCSFFEQNRITHIINCMENGDYEIPSNVIRLNLKMEDVPLQPLQISEPLSLLNELYDLTDSEAFSRLQAIPYLSQQAKDHQESHFEHDPLVPSFPRGIRVYVHCLMGISRSASIILAFLINRFHLSPVNAFRIVKAQRHIVRPNDGFIRQLCQFWCDEGCPDERIRPMNELGLPMESQVTEQIFERHMSEIRRRVGQL
ncbi:putative Dual specificity phosphatase, catalytic domain containing protein [Blattamonas nauphoetae]|uniref:protein-tyrosine-phosphatase n=1 Tax=Blattamonas nauphoetae TaxID=2049346 RepID=A0ABQ9Y2W1_9EUKA|nr:putative Dual specificity phosphatase, catalytic domain containing protein [Blattamonas nauphoetae]